MMDIVMAAMLMGCFGLMKLFVDFCEHQIETKEK